MRRQRWRVVAVIAVLAAVVGTGWAVQHAAAGRKAPSGASRRAADSAAYSVAVTRNGALLRRFTLAELHALPASRVTIDGKVQDGPTLLAVLAAAGVRGHPAVTVLGAGLRDSGKLVLPVSRVNGRVVVDFADRGTVKVCSPQIAWGHWVRDVKEIRVD
jgi:hypothetical protein